MSTTQSNPNCFKHVHSSTIKHWADGALIEFLTNENKWELVDKPKWEPNTVYRVKPDSDYAIWFIQAHLGNKAKNAYLDWLNGSYVHFNKDTVFKTLTLSPAHWFMKPFEAYIETFDEGYDIASGNPYEPTKAI